MGSTRRNLSPFLTHVRHWLDNHFSDTWMDSGGGSVNRLESTFSSDFYFMGREQGKNILWIHKIATTRSFVYL